MYVMTKLIILINRFCRKDGRRFAKAERKFKVLQAKPNAQRYGVIGAAHEPLSPRSSPLRSRSRGTTSWTRAWRPSLAAGPECARPEVSGKSLLGIELLPPHICGIHIETPSLVKFKNTLL